MSAIAPTLQGFFTERLVKQRRVSPRTIASYRDSLKLLFVLWREERLRLCLIGLSGQGDLLPGETALFDRRVGCLHCRHLGHLPQRRLEFTLYGERVRGVVA